MASVVGEIEEMERISRFVIPGRAESADPESITTAREYGFRIPAFGRPRNDLE